MRRDTQRHVLEYLDRFAGSSFILNSKRRHIFVAGKLNWENNPPGNATNDCMKIVDEIAQWVAPSLHVLSKVVCRRVFPGYSIVVRVSGVTGKGGFPIHRAPTRLTYNIYIYIYSATSWYSFVYCLAWVYNYIFHNFLNSYCYWR
uniref:Uncharacterized protein n=1 Tax=Davidia involucrata TaxID=16924 RepID=A0A5B7AZE3_DAVIN